MLSIAGPTVYESHVGLEVASGEHFWRVPHNNRYSLQVQVSRYVQTYSMVLPNSISVRSDAILSLDPFSNDGQD